MERYELPLGWVWTILGEIADLFGGGTPSRQNPEHFLGEIIWLTPTEIPKHNISVISDSKEKITKLGMQKSSARLLPKGTVLMTSRASIGYVAIAGTEVTTNQGFASFVCSPAIYNFYLAYWLKANTDLFLEQATGTTFKEISKANLRPFLIPLPPLAEQQRIVDEIEAQFTRLDSGISSLKQAQARLKRYRAAVLKAACEGKLVPQDPNDEPANVLLERILYERRQKWDSNGRYEDPILPNIDNLPELPEGWLWMSLDQLTYLITSGSRGWAEYYNDNGAIFIRAQDIKTDSLVLDTVAHVDLPRGVEGRRTRIDQYDLLVTITGANVTKTALVKQQLNEAYVNQHVALVRPVYSQLSPYLYFWIISPSQGRRQLEKYAYGMGKPGLNLTNLRELMIALPPLEEQQRIVEEVERRLSVVEEVEATIKANLKRAERLRQAILKQAFEGKLVPQDPNDEPATVLLERIKAERAKQTSKNGQQLNLFQE
jgi:type I restriction enzyme, S subunit